MIFNIDFILLNLLLFFTFLKAGENIAKNRNYWYNANWCIVIFTFVQGCRFARGNDYHGYSQLFKNGFNEENPFFSYINEFLKLLGINQYSCFMVYAFVFILCAMIFMHDYKRYAKYMFPLFLGGFLLFEEYMIRQAFSYSFFFIYLKYLFRIRISKLNDIISNKKNILLCIIFAIITLAIHTGNIINIFIFTVLYLFWKRPFNPYFSIPLYICCVYILPDIFNFTWLDPILNFAAETNDKAAEYVKHAEYWFSAEGKNDIYTKNVLAEFIQVIASSSVMYLGYKLIKNRFYNNLVLINLLNVFIIGLCIESLFVNLEILRRIGYVIDRVGYFLIPVIIYYRPRNIYFIHKLLYLSFIWFMYYYTKYVLFSGKVSMFIWDTPYSFFS